MPFFQDAPSIFWTCYTKSLGYCSCFNYHVTATRFWLRLLIRIPKFCAIPLQWPMVMAVVHINITLSIIQTSLVLPWTLHWNFGNTFWSVSPKGSVSIPWTPQIVHYKSFNYYYLWIVTLLTSHYNHTLYVPQTIVCCTYFPMCTCPI